MPRRGRPRKNFSLYSITDLIEYTSDSETDNFNVRQNVSYEVSVRDRSPLRNPSRDVQPGQNDLQPQMDMEISEAEEPDQQEQELPQHNDENQEQDQEQEDDNEVMIDLHFVEGQGNGQEARQEEEELPHSSEEDNIIHANPEHYDVIFAQLKSNWLSAELQHCVSKTASDTFWRLGLQHFSTLQGAPGRTRKTPQFKTIRRNMYSDFLPDIELEIAYRDKGSGEITVVKDAITPLKRFSPSKYDKLYEIGTVKVR